MSGRRGSKEVAVIEGGLGQVPDFVNKGDARGNENITQDDIIVPRLNLIQTISPECDENDPNFVEGAKAGMFINNLTRELYESPVVIIPVAYRKEYVIFKERSAGGGFKGSYPSEAEAQNFIEMSAETNLEIIETGVHFCLLVKDNGSFEEVVVTMTSTKLKASRKLNSLVRMRGTDRFAGTYKVFSVRAENEHGKYHTIDVANAGWASQDLYKKAEKIYGAIVAGEREVDYSGPEVTEEEAF